MDGLKDHRHTNLPLGGRLVHVCSLIDPDKRELDMGSRWPMLTKLYKPLPLRRGQTIQLSIARAKELERVVWLANGMAVIRLGQTTLHNLSIVSIKKAFSSTLAWGACR